MVTKVDLIPTWRSWAIACSAVVLAVAIGFGIARFPESLAAPVTAGAATALALAVLVVGFRRRRLTSPVVISGVPLLLGLAASMDPVTTISWAWNSESIAYAWAIALAPLCGMGVVHLLRGQGMTHRHPFPSRVPSVNIARILAVCTSLVIVGTVAQLYEYHQIGSIPLFSGDIGAVKTQLGNTGLIGLLPDLSTLAAIISAWTYVALRPQLAAWQRRYLVGVAVFVPCFFALQGGRIEVTLPAISMACVVAPYLPRRRLLRLVAVAGAVLAVGTTGVLYVRLHQQGASDTRLTARLLATNEGLDRSLPSALGTAALINLGEGFRVANEFHEDDIRLPPFTTSVYFAHHFLSRAQSAEVLANAVTGFWITSTYAGPLIVDLGPALALLWGLLLGMVFQFVYEQRTRGYGWNWVYAYLAGPMALLFYSAIFTQYAFAWIDPIVLAVLGYYLTQGSAVSRPLHVGKPESRRQAQFLARTR